MIPVNTVELLARVRNRINDKSALVFDDAEVLEVCDDSVREMFTSLRTHGDDIELDSLDVTTASLTQVEPGIFSWQPPEIVADVQMFELRESDGRSVQMRKVSLEEKDYGTLGMRLLNDAWVWHRGPRKTVRFIGMVTAYQTLRVWFVRAIPPMFQSLGAGAGTTTTFLPVQSSPGLKNRNDLYVGQEFEVVAGNANDLNKLVRCTAFGVAGGTTTLTFAPALSAATGVTTRLAMTVPLPPEHSKFLVVMIARTLFGRQGSAEQQALIEREYAQLREDFDTGISRPSTGEPPRLFSSRTL